MISEQRARSLILAEVPGVQAQQVPLAGSAGRYLVRDYRATIASPPFDNSAMDGYAVRVCEGQEGALRGAQLRVVGEQPAGASRGLSLDRGEAIRIFTGAPLPAATDAVIMQEDADAFEEPGEPRPPQSQSQSQPQSQQQPMICIREPVVEGENIRPAGADLCVGQLIAAAGEKMSAPLVAALASQGLEKVEVGRAPQISLITTGDEVVRAGEAKATGGLSRGQIYNSNGPMLRALLGGWTGGGAGGIGWRHAGDEARALRAAFEESLDGGDEMIFLVGGVSVGQRDLVKSVLDEAGVERVFWRVKLKPGKPLYFGRAERDGRRVLVFGLPGNPVSGFVCASVFGAPAVRKWMGAQDSEWGPRLVEARAGETLSNPGDRPHYLRGHLDWENMSFKAAGLQQSHGIVALSRANALARLAGDGVVEQGDCLPVLPI
ncbi:MAG: molybdopterin molybdotransferase MoeA [Verrucomicrobiales bacterium]